MSNIYRFRHIAMLDVHDKKCMITYINDYDYDNIIEYVDVNNHVFDLSCTQLYDRCENVLRGIQPDCPYYINLDTKTQKITEIRSV